MDKFLAELEGYLTQLCDAHQQFLVLIERKKQALRSAKVKIIQECCQEENLLIQKISAIEKRRLHVVGRITGFLTPDAKVPLSLTDIATSLSEPEKDRLILQQQRLIGLVENVKLENSIVQSATQALLGHVQGVIQMIGQAFDSVGTYGNKGKVVSSGVMASSFSTTG